jgi:hypothetical protein
MSHQFVDQTLRDRAHFRVLEVLETILEWLLRNTKALCTCISVSHTFCFLSQRLLYSDITFGPCNWCSSDPQLVNPVLLASDRAHVRYLTIGMYYDAELEVLPRRSCISHSQSNAPEGGSLRIEEPLV